jgi:hypothetical protein
MLRCKKLDYSPSEPDQKKIRPEREEKPVVQPTTKSSEETHGGTESTVSIPFSLSGAQAGERREEIGLSQAQTQKGSAKEAEEEVSGVSENGGDGEDSAPSSGEGLEDEEGADANGDEFEGGFKASEDDGDEGGIYVGKYNTEQVVDLSHRRTSLFLATEFYRLLELLMEEKTKVFETTGADEFNVRRLILRPYEGKPLSHYRQSRVKEGIVILLDNSGSMEWWAEQLQLLASIALTKRDVELYAAPNGTIQTRLTNRGYVPVDHYEVIQKLRGRRVIYVGDFDGANTPVELSWSNEVIWICPEMRYRRFKAHNWVDYTEEDYKGVFMRAWTLEEVFSALKSIDRFYNLWIDFHENHVFSDDEVTGD